MSIDLLGVVALLKLRKISLQMQFYAVLHSAITNGLVIASLFYSEKLYTISLMCYSNSICIDIKLNKPTLQEQWSLDHEMLEEVSMDT